jgi:hypothetical protein
MAGRVMTTSSVEILKSPFPTARLMFATMCSQKAFRYAATTSFTVLRSFRSKSRASLSWRESRRLSGTSLSSIKRSLNHLSGVSSMGTLYPQVSPCAGVDSFAPSQVVDFFSQRPK